MTRAPDTEGALADVGHVPPMDLNARVIYVPVRHHSPACARNVRRVLETVRPDAVLIEAPCDAEAHVSLLQADTCVPPVAIYSTWRERKGTDTHHHAAYYPLAEFSPEWVALRTAREIGARVRFIDLAYPDMVRSGLTAESGALLSLQSEDHFRHSQFLALAAQRVGARDSDDLWDHLFESAGAALDAATFFRGVLAYCACARADTSHAAMEADGTLARERHMAACIAEEQGRVVVVTGGFHTVALADTEPRRTVPDPSEASGSTLMRYSFEQLDRLNGYAAGLPLPGFYDALWRDEPTESIVVRVAREIRGDAGEPSVAEAIAAVEHARGLQRMRGHRTATREDVLDAVRSVFVKGSADVEGVRVLAAARRQLAGARRGSVPPEAGNPPLVTDFERLAAELRLELDDVRERRIVLDGYRKAAHRRCSRFLHAVRLLGVPFATFERGPDFAAGRGLDRIQEVWSYRWSPATESALIEASRFGGSIREAAAGRLEQAFREVESRDGRSARAATLVLTAAQAGLHARIPDLVPRLARLLAADAEFESVVAACAQLRLAHVSCEPLELHSETSLLELAVQAWMRAAYLLGAIGEVPEDDEETLLDALCSWAEAASAVDESIDRRQVLHEVLQSLVGRSSAGPVLSGAAHGLLHADARLSDDDVAAAVRARIAAGASVQSSGPRFLRGLLRTDRSCLWQVPALVGALDELLRVVEDDEFLALCPHLRLAFSALSPRETDRVAAMVGERAGRPGWLAGRVTSFTTADAMLGRRIDSLLSTQLEADGLSERIDG
ncbi:MAG: DUF5682 family protein [Planctomycetes bacterium]|nr:DUF5682 family protein [Planctomycetota bacterium]